MRTKDEILEDAGVSNANMLAALGLEVSIDIRDVFQEMLIKIGSIEYRLVEIRDNAKNKLGGKDGGI